MKPRQKLVDEKCYELAEHFLADEKNITEADKRDLAAEIQTAIEEWFGAGDFWNR